MTDTPKDNVKDSSDVSPKENLNQITPSETLSIHEIVEGIVQSAVKTAQEDTNGSKRKNVWRQRPKGQSGTATPSDSPPAPPSPHTPSTPSSLSSPTPASSTSTSDISKPSEDRSATKKKRKITYSKRQLIALSHAPICQRPPKTMLADCQRRDIVAPSAAGGDENTPRYRRRASLTNEPHRVGGRKWAEAVKKDDNESGTTDTTAKVTTRTKDRYSSWRDREAEEAADREGRRGRNSASERDRDGRARPYDGRNRRNDGDTENTPEWFTADAKSDFDLGSTVLDRDADRNLLERRGLSKSDSLKGEIEPEKKTGDEKQTPKSKDTPVTATPPKAEAQPKDSSLPKALEKLNIAKDASPVVETKVELEKISGASEEDRAALGRWFPLDQLQQLSQGSFGSSSPSSSRWKYPQEDYEALLMGPSRSANPLSGGSGSSRADQAITPSTKSESVLSPLFAAMASASTPTGQAPRSYSSKWGFVLEDDTEGGSSITLGSTAVSTTVGGGGGGGGTSSETTRSIFTPTPMGSQSPLRTSFKSPSDLSHTTSLHSTPHDQSSVLPRTASAGPVNPTQPSAPVPAPTSHTPRLITTGLGLGSPLHQSSPIPASAILQRTIPPEGLNLPVSVGGTGRESQHGTPIFTRVPPSPIATMEGVSKAFPFPPGSGGQTTPTTRVPTGMGSFSAKSFVPASAQQSPIPGLPRQGSGSPLVKVSPSSGQPGQRGDKEDGQRLFRINVEDLFKTLQHQSLPPLPSMPAPGAGGSRASGQQSPGLGSPGLGSPGLGSPGLGNTRFLRQESPGPQSSPLTGGFGSFSQQQQPTQQPHRQPSRDHFFDYEAEQLKQLHAQQQHSSTPQSHAQFPSFKPRNDVDSHGFPSHQQRLAHGSTASQSPSRPDSDAMASFQRFGIDRSGSLKTTPTTPIADTSDKSGKAHDTSSFQPKPHEPSRRGFDYRPPARSFDSRNATSGGGGTGGGGNSNSGGPGFSPGFFPPAFPLHFPHSAQQHHGQHGSFPYGSHGSSHGFQNYRKSHDSGRHDGEGGRGGSSSGSHGGGSDFRGGSGTGLSINLPPSAPLASLSTLGARASPTVKDAHVPNHHRQPQQPQQPTPQQQMPLHHQMHLPPMMPMNLPLTGKASVRRSTSHDSLNIAHYPLPGGGKFQGPASYSALPLTSQSPASRIPVSSSGSGVTFNTNPPVTIPPQLAAAQFKKP